MGFGSGNDECSTRLTDSIMRILFKAVPNAERVEASKELRKSLEQSEEKAIRTCSYDVFSMQAVDLVKCFLDECVRNKDVTSISQMNRNKGLDCVKDYLTSRGLRT